MKRYIILVILIIGSIIGITYSFRYFSSGNLTANEQVLFSIFLTIVSFFLSWVVSHYYYEISHEENIAEIKKDYQSNLKIYASKAAEKVTNLSSEFTKLANYLKEEFDEDEYDTDQENLHAKKERIYSAIHIVNTLKSINDGSLSDWKGVIPEEIEEIAEEEREKVESINTILNQYKSVVSSSEHGMDYGFTDENLKEDIQQLNKKLDLAISNVAGVTRKPKKEVAKKENIKNNCPKCGVLINYKQRPISSSRKWIRCVDCKTKLACRWSPTDGFSIVEYREDIHGILDNRKQGSEAPVKDEFDEAFVQSVREKLPAQPWPKKIGDSISKEISASSSKVHKAINILIDRGVFKHQVNGILYIQDPNQHNTDSGR